VGILIVPDMKVWGQPACPEVKNKSKVRRKINVHFYSRGSMKLNPYILLLAHMVYL
jgi:hypothetical protein